MTIALTDDERAVARNFLLTTKPTIFAANVDEATLGTRTERTSHVVREIAEKESAENVIICAHRKRISGSPPDERIDYLKYLAFHERVDRRSRAYHLLGLMSFLTAEKEVRLTIRRGPEHRMPQARFTRHRTRIYSRET